MPPHTTPTMTTGERIAAWRAYRGMTQETCAGLVGKSLSWWKKIESGARRIEKLSDLIVISQLLRVPELSDLTGVLEWSLARDQMRPVPVLPGIRAAILRRDPERTGTPIPLTDLRPRIRHARETFHLHRMFVSEVGRLLPGLILDTTAAYRAADGPDRRALAGALSDVYLLTSETLRDAGDFPLAQMAVDRCHLYAREADDPLRAAWATWDSSGVLKDMGLPEEGLGQCLEAVAELEHLADRNPTDDVLSVLGEIYCQTSLMHAHCAEEGLALRMMDRGAEAYARIGAGYRNPISAYVREGADIIAAPVYTAMGKARQAIQAADRLDITQTPSRAVQSIWMVNVARGYAYRREDAGTLHMLRRAEQASPEIVARSAHAREMVREMVRRDRKTVARDVHEFAQRVGLLS
ncbi:MAG TPA: helix-turn-helix transcriptional regulator [Mycobacteriales bacterium]